MGSHFIHYQCLSVTQPSVFFNPKPYILHLPKVHGSATRRAPPFGRRLAHYIVLLDVLIDRLACGLLYLQR